jgi:hypothetical protein
MASRQQQPQRPGGTPQPQGLASQLNPQQMQALQEYLRNIKATTGQDATAQLIQEWMAGHRLNLGNMGGQQQGQQQPMDHQQQALMAAQRQAQLHAQQQAQHHQQQQQQQDPAASSSRVSSLAFRSTVRELICSVL